MKKTLVTTFVVAATAVIIALMPFHAFLTVWASSLIGHYTLLRLWKELLVFVLGLVALWLVFRRPALCTQFLGSWLFRLMLIYFGLMVVLGLVALARHTVNRSALYEGLIEDLRLVVFFFIAWVAASYSPWLRAHWRQLLLIPAAVVVVFGLLQAFVLPADFLSHFGYAASTIKPFDTVDQNLQFIRVQSTMRGADPLGAYLVVVLAALTAIASDLVFRRQGLTKHQKTVVLWGIFGAATLAVLYFTYSRSAYVGALIAMVVAVWRTLPSKRVRQWLFIAGLAVCVVFGVTAYALRHNPTFEDTFFHTSQLSKSKQSSNHNHQEALKAGMHDLVHQPFGLGPGSAGPASQHNNHPARIAENYFLQVGQEAGWLGLGLFVAITALVGTVLWDKRTEPDLLALTLLASLAGLIVVNLLLPAWTDDTLAYAWWGLAGIAAAMVSAPETGKLTQTKHLKR